MKKRGKIILLIIILLTLCFIWGNSCLPKDTSSGESNFVMNLISPILGLFVGRENVTEHLVRKLAHFTEYALLGVEFSLFFAIIRNRDKKIVWRYFPIILIHAVLTSFIDETIQIFSGRGPAIADMWIDTAGAASGTVIVLLILFILARKKNNGE